jgi:hypothetical protein
MALDSFLALKPADRKRVIAAVAASGVEAGGINSFAAMLTVYVLHDGEAKLVIRKTADKKRLTDHEWELLLAVNLTIAASVGGGRLLDAARRRSASLPLRIRRAFDGAIATMVRATVRSSVGDRPAVKTAVRKQRSRNTSYG